MSTDSSDDHYDKARQRVEAKIGFLSHLAVFAVINIVFLIVAGADWLWVTLFWGIGLALHGFGVFFQDSSAIADWKERQIQKELDRKQPKPSPAAIDDSDATKPNPTPPDATKP